jgi:hypothetical protein
VSPEVDGQTYAPQRQNANLWPGCLALVVGVLVLWLASGVADVAWRTALVFVALASMPAVVAYQVWSSHFRFGTSRLVLARPDVRAGETFVGTLEAGPRLAEAREVRFELVELHCKDTWSGNSGNGYWGEHVRAASVVDVSSYQVVPGHTLVPVSLPVPADGWASFKRGGAGLTLNNVFIVGTRVTEHAWEVRAFADVNGKDYRAEFRITIAPLYEVPPYTPRPIGIPQSDKRRPPEVK